VDRPESKYVKTADGVWIGYQVFGEGPYDLVVNDGWMGNLDANWDIEDHARVLRALGERARLITFDRRGFGISDRPGTPGQMAIEKSLDDMRAVMDAAGSRRAVVYGFEAGAAVSLLFAASFPEWVTALVLHAPLVRYWRSSDFPWGWTQDDAAEWDRAIVESWGTPEFWAWNLQGMGGETSSDELRAWARWSRLCASPGAVLFTDIVGSTERASSLGDHAWGELIVRHHAIVRAMLGRYRGSEIDTAGDGFFATFDGPARAVRCAQQVAEAVRPLGIEIRARVHTGEVETVDGRRPA
jgi:pimeloyl-ACP methyl ester carboxylesterase